MKRFILIPFVTVLVSGLIFGVCVVPASAQTDVTKLSFALQSPSVGWGAKVVNAWSPTPQFHLGEACRPYPVILRYPLLWQVVLLVFLY